MESIIKEYTRNTFYKDFNKWQMSLDTQYYLTIAYFSAQLSYNLNKYGEKKKNKKEDYYYKENKVIYRGITTALYNILPYKRAEKKIIIFPSFTSTSFDEKEGRKWLIVKEGVCVALPPRCVYALLRGARRLWRLPSAAKKQSIQSSCRKRVRRRRSTRRRSCATSSRRRRG